VLVICLLSVGVAYPMSCIQYLNNQDYRNAVLAGEKELKVNVDGNTFFCLGRAYYYMGNTDKAFENLKNAEKFYYKDEDLMYLYSWMGSAYMDIKDTDNALLYYNKSFNLIKKLGKKEYENIALNNLGEAYRMKGDLDKAMAYYKDALKIAKKPGDKSTILNNISLIYATKKDYKKAVEYLKQAYDYAGNAGDYITQTQTQINLADVYKNLSDYQIAEQLLLSAIKKAQQIGSKIVEALAETSLGFLYEDLNKIDEAILHLQNALRLYKEINKITEATNVKNYIDTLMAKKKKYDNIQ